MRWLGILVFTACWPAGAVAESAIAHGGNIITLAKEKQPPIAHSHPSMTHSFRTELPAQARTPSVSIAVDKLSSTANSAPSQRSHFTPPSIRQQRQLEQLALAQLQMLAIVPQFAAVIQPRPTAAAAHASASTDAASSSMRLRAFWQQQGLDLRDISRVLDDNFIQLQHRITALLSLEQQAWPTINPQGWLRPGDSHRALPLIAERLWLLGDVNGSVSLSSRYDSSLAEAVRHFQLRHGLKQDAVIGPKTLYWLNRTPQARAQQLVMQYVQETALVKRLPADYLLVNVPQFELTLVAQQQLVLRSKVVVGLPYRQTPMLESEISSVVLNPAWHVPRSIMRRTILPKVRQDGTYLAQHHYDVYDWQGNLVQLASKDWAQLAQGKFHYRLVQRPNEQNSLGRYKFHFSNNFSVYLHDTPEKALFSATNRARSSGCVRVDKAAELAFGWQITLLRIKNYGAKYKMIVRPPNGLN